MTELVFYLACVVPVLCMTLLCLGIGLFAWRVIARVETAHRDMLKAVLVMSQNPAAQMLSGTMEMGDAAAVKAEAERVNGGPVRIRRPAQ